MPKTTFLDSILGRPSQTYAPDAPSGSDAERVASDVSPKKVLTASSLANPLTSPRGKSHLARGSIDEQSDTMSASTSLRSRLGRKRSKPRVRDVSDSALQVPDASSPNTFSSWWENRSMMRPGPGSLFSEPGESFSERWRRDFAQPPRGARSELEGPSSASSSPAPPAPPFPNSFKKSEPAVAPLGQSTPSLLAPVHKRSQSKSEQSTPPKRSSNVPSPALAHSEHMTSPTVTRTRDSGQWYEFVRSLEQRDAARRAKDTDSRAEPSAPQTETRPKPSTETNTAQEREPEGDVSEMGYAVSMDASVSSIPDLAPPIDAKLPYFSVFPPVANKGAERLAAVSEEDENASRIGIAFSDPMPEKPKTPAPASDVKTSTTSAPTSEAKTTPTPGTMSVASLPRSPIGMLAPPVMSPSASLPGLAPPLLDASPSQEPKASAPRVERAEPVPARVQRTETAPVRVERTEPVPPRVERAGPPPQAWARPAQAPQPQPVQATQPKPAATLAPAPAPAPAPVAPIAPPIIAPPTPAKPRTQKTYPTPQPEGGLFQEGAKAPKATLDEPVADPDLLRLSWSPALYYAQEGEGLSAAAPEPSDALAPSPMLHDGATSNASNFVSALDKHDDGATSTAGNFVSAFDRYEESKPAPSVTSSTSPSKLRGLKQPASYAPQRAEATTSQGLSHGTSKGLGAKYKSPLNNWPQQPERLGSPRQVKPTPVRAPTQPSARPVTSATRLVSAPQPERTLAPFMTRNASGPSRAAQRMSAISIADSDILDLDPNNAPWTMTSEVGHYDRSELHGTDLNTPEMTPRAPGRDLATPAPAKAPDTPHAYAASNTPAATPGRSVLDRPRNRGPRPTEMGGIAIAHGSLPAQSPGPRQLRSTSDSARFPPVPPLPASRFASASHALAAREEDTSTDSVTYVDAPAAGGDPLAFQFNDVPELPASRSLADTLFAYKNEPKNEPKVEPKVEEEPILQRNPSSSSSTRYKVTPADPLPVWNPELAEKAAAARAQPEATQATQVAQAAQAAPEAEEMPRLAYLQTTPSKGSISPYAAQELATAPAQMSSTPVMHPASYVEGVAESEKALPSTPDRAAAAAPRQVLLEINGEVLEYEPSESSIAPSAAQTPARSPAQPVYAQRPPANYSPARPVGPPGSPPVHPAPAGYSPARPSAGMQGPPMQRPPMQRPPMQRPPMQRPPMQRPPMQRPPMQRPPKSPSMPSQMQGYGPGFASPQGPQGPQGPGIASPRGYVRPYGRPPPGVRPPPTQAPQGYASQPPQGYTQAPQGYTQGPQGYAPPPQGYTQPPQGYAPPQAPQGYTSPQSQGYAQPHAPQGSASSPQPQGYAPHASPQAPQGFAPPAPAYGSMGPGSAPTSPYAPRPPYPRPQAYPQGYARPPPRPRPDYAPAPDMQQRAGRAPVRHAPPRAQMVLPPGERSTSRPSSPLEDMPQIGGMRRISSTPDVALGGRMHRSSPTLAQIESGEYASPPGSVGGQSNWYDARGRLTESRMRHSPDVDAQSTVTTLRQYAGSPLGTREPSLVASTSVLNPSTASVMKKAPLGASTNQVLGLSSETESVMSPPSISSSVSRTRISTKDLLRSRPTMVTVNVTSGGPPPSGSALRRKLSTASSDAGRRRRGSEAGSDQPVQSTVALSSHTAPPRKISPTQVLVQIIAVAIDNIDRALLRERAATDPSTPFVPGRSFCGRVVESGWDVKKIRKGDTVFGLQDYRKCGALAEFMSIDQDLVARAPEGRLSAEQIAALPSTGVMVHQIVQNHCMMLPRGSRVLILNAHDSIGLLAMQEASRLGLIIIAHVPVHAADGVSICEANGATEVITGDALWAINLLHESSFNLIVDTVGGRQIYDACRRILAHQGQFVTCFGDDQALPTPTYRSHLRSLRRSFFRKDRKGIGYEWIGIDAGPDCRIALESVKTAAQRGAICPRIQSILPLEDAARALEDDGEADKTAGVVVVRVS